MINGKSHWLFQQSIMTELLKRGHEVTCITQMTWIGQKPVNYSEVLVDPPFDLEAICMCCHELQKNQMKNQIFVFFFLNSATRKSFQSG